MASSPFPVRPFRFGVQLSGATNDRSWAETVRQIEGLGYDVVTMPDHFGGQLAPTPALQAALEATTTLRAGALVFANDYRHPAILAKELATMDVLSGGRLEIGLGAGWMKSDYEQLGLTYDRPGLRVDRLAEALTIIRGVLGPEPFSFAGEHYTITDYDGFPKPAQQPCPPMLVGGGGRRVLSLAARHADIVGINGTLQAGVVGPEAIATMTAAAVDEKVAIVADAAGDRLGQIELNVRTFLVSVTDDRAGRLADVAAYIAVDEQMVAESPFALIGSAQSITEDLLARRERYGFSYVIVGPDEVESFAPVVARLAGT